MRRLNYRAVALGVICGVLMSITSVVMLPIGAITLFRARPLYIWIARWMCRAMLAIYGVRVRVHHEGGAGVGAGGFGIGGFPRTQTVYISNHTSTLDMFILVALGLPNCRFFLSGFLRKWVPLAIISSMMGSFFTVPQDRPDQRRRIFRRAGRTLARTGESVYLSPEGGRIVDGAIGPFNKGAFHLATVLQAPIVPMYFHIPAAIDPGLGFNVRPGTVDVYVLPPIETATWRVADVMEHKEDVRAVFVRVQQEKRCA
jgi:1-acyl-sn-glycerol-3-phosphate acyltransferase